MLMLPHITEKLNGLLHTLLEVDVPYYVSIDASSYHSSDEMIYYTHHREMDALHYIWVDVSLDYVSEWMFCCTHIT
jgi:hypothetical protein